MVEGRKRKNGETAKGSSATEAAEVLIKHGANLEAKNYQGETPLHVALQEWGETYFSSLYEKRPAHGAGGVTSPDLPGL